jgi:hypothetical protein
MDALLIKRLAGEVASTGATGGDMTAKLASLAGQHDLSPTEMQQISAAANRAVQLALYKEAEDKRFKFALCEASKVVDECRKAARIDIRDSSEFGKVAAAIDEAGGDPFAPIYVDDSAELSLFQQPVDEKLAFDLKMAESTKLLQELDRSRLELLAVKNAGLQVATQLAGKAQDSFDSGVQAAADLLATGVKFTDLYYALRQAVSGATATDQDRKKTDDLALLILDALKSRGVPNHRLGFRFQGDVAALNKMSADDILALAKQALGITDEWGDICPETVKKAQRYVEYVSKVAPKKGPDQPFEAAAEFLQKRPSQKDHPSPAPYLDDKATSNTPGGKIRIANADNEFVVSIRDLLTAQERLGRAHNANEYLGLKLKQIEQALRDLGDAKKKAETEFDKEAMLPLVGAVAKGVGALAKAAPALTAASAAKSMLPAKPQQQSEAV